MKLSNYLFILIAFFAIYSCSPKPSQPVAKENVKYYRTMLFSESPWDLERGSHEITQDQAKTINNYKFTWNDNNQLISVEYNRNDSLLNYPPSGTAKVVYSYNNNLQVKHFFDEKGLPAKRDEVSVFEYTLDSTGMRVALRFLDEAGQPVENRNKIHNYTWTKTADGMIRELRYNLAGESVVMNPFCPFYELRFSYDPKGYLVRLANYDNDTLYNCTAENCGDVGVSYFLFENNESGDLKSFSVHNTTGRMSNLYWGWAKRMNTIDANGYVTETAMFDQDDEYLGGKNVPITQTIYDEHGAPIKRVSMDKDRNIINDPNNGVAVTEYKYNEIGQRTETLRFDKDGKPVEVKG